METIVFKTQSGKGIEYKPTYTDLDSCDYRLKKKERHIKKGAIALLAIFIVGIVIIVVVAIVLIVSLSKRNLLTAKNKALEPKPVQKAEVKPINAATTTAQGYKSKIKYSPV